MSHINMKALTIILLSLLTISLFTLSNANAEKNQTFIPTALEGYDAISYFNGDNARKGSNEYQTEYAGKKYIFVSEENKNLFAANPEFFLPQFSGFCANTATQQSPVVVDPSIYLIDKGKLFQFSNLAAKDDWLKRDDKVNESNVGLIELALDGYDITTYFDNAAPIKGVETYQAVYKDKRYIFVNKDNQQKFAASPEKFLPQFGGYCAHSVSLGTPLKSQPDLYVVDKGNLLFFSSNEAKSAWEKEPVKVNYDANRTWKFEDKKRKKKIAAQNLWTQKNTVKLFSF